MIATDDLERMLVEIVTGKEPTLRTSEADAIRVKLQAECDAIIVKGGTVEVPHEIPDVDFDFRTGGGHRREIIHQAADAHYKPLFLMIMAAFLRGKKAYKASGTDAAVSAIRASLLETLPSVLLKTMVAGGDVGLGMLRKLRTTEFNPSQERDENGRWTDGGGSVVTKGTPEQNAAFNVAIDALPQKIKAELKNTVVQLVPSVEDFGASHSAGEVQGSHEGNSVLIKAGPDQTMSLYHEVGHVTSNFLAERPKFKDAFAKDTGKKLIGQMAYYGSNPREAIAQSFAYHMGGVDENKIRFEKTFKNTHMTLGDHLQHFGKMKTLGFPDQPSDESLRAARDTKTVGAMKIRFDAANPNAVKWAKQHAAELVTNITETTREHIRAAVERAQETGEDAYDDILDAVGDTDRAHLIARHESLLSAHKGQRQAWDQAIEKGLLTGDERRVWITTGDEKLCPICEDLDGETADLDGEYPDGYEGPPAHVQCRCTEGLA